MQSAASKSMLVGVVQMCSHNNPMQNCLKARSFIEKCCKEGAQLVCLPECFAFMGSSNKSETGV